MLHVWRIKSRDEGRTKPNLRTFTRRDLGVLKNLIDPRGLGLLYQRSPSRKPTTRDVAEIRKAAACVANAPNRFFEFKDSLTGIGKRGDGAADSGNCDRRRRRRRQRPSRRRRRRRRHSHPKPPKTQTEPGKREAPAGDITTYFSRRGGDDRR